LFKFFGEFERAIYILLVESSFVSFLPELASRLALQEISKKLKKKLFNALCALRNFSCCILHREVLNPTGNDGDRPGAEFTSKILWTKNSDATLALLLEMSGMGLAPSVSNSW
jgi:hypothetical protein